MTEQRRPDPPWRERVTTTLALVLRWLSDRLGVRAQPPDPALVRRIVILKPCCLGDVLMSTPLIDAIQRGYPHATITYAVRRHARAAIENHPAIIEIIDMGTRPTSFIESWRGAWHLVATLARGRFDLAIVLDRSPLLAILPWMARIPHRAGIDSQGRGFALSVRVPWVETEHECALYLNIAQALGTPQPNARMSFFPSPQAHDEAHHLMSALPSRVVAIAPGGGINPGMLLTAKRWPQTSYATLITRIINDTGMSIVLLGDRHDDALALAIVASLTIQERGYVHNFAGRLSFSTTGALLQRCALFVGNDSAPMHLASAVGIPTVAIFGPTSPHMYRPWNTPSTVVWSGLSCSPCFVHGHMPPCPYDLRCLRLLPVENVWIACQQMLGTSVEQSANRDPDA